jgi:hypothetical protein
MAIPDFLACNTAIRVSDLDLKSKIFISNQITSIDKEPWENFWQIYNLTQSNTQIQYESIESEIQENNDYDCLTYHDPKIHHIIKQLIDNNIVFEREGGFFISNNDDFAEAMFGFNESKIVILPLSDEDEKIFINNGFEIIAPESFNINMIRK